MAKLYIKSRFGIIPNEILRCETLSLKAKGLYGYIQSKPDNWDFSSEKIAIESKDSRDSIRTGLIELESHGLLTRDKKRADSGHWEIEYTLHEAINQDGKSVTVTRTENPTSENPTSENPSSNKERDSKKDIVNKSLIVSPKGETEQSSTEYGDKGINMMQKFLRHAVGVTAFKDSKERWYVTHCYNLMKNIGPDEFNTRLETILSDPFKAKNSNKLAYLYGEMKSFIHSPVVGPKKTERKSY